MKDKGMKLSVHAHELGENDALTRALAFVIYTTMQNGVNEIGESATLMVPSMELGYSRETAIPCGEWEIKLTKVGE